MDTGLGEAGMASVYITLITVVGGIFMEWIRRDTKGAIKEISTKVDEAKVARLDSTASILEGVSNAVPTAETKQKAMAARGEVDSIKGTGSGSMPK